MEADRGVCRKRVPRKMKNDKMSVDIVVRISLKARMQEILGCVGGGK